jgi:PGF-CTERM protein/surface glycoprotein (TIGR04207 family)
MTSPTDKHRAVFLAILMILSVFAGTIAFSGTVAASLDQPVTQGGDINNTTVVEASNNSHPIELNATLNTTTDTNVRFVVSLSDGNNFDLSNLNNSTVQLTANDSVTEVTATSINDGSDTFNATVDTSGAGNDNTAVNLSFDLNGVRPRSVSSDQDFSVSFALDNETDGDVEDTTQIGTLSVQDTPAGAPELIDAVHYEDTGDEGAGVELSFTEPVSVPDASDITLIDDDGNTVTGTSISPSPSSATSSPPNLNGRYFIDTSGTILTGDVEVVLTSDINDADNDPLVSDDTDDNISVTVAPQTVKFSDDKTIYEGGNLAIVNGSTDVSVDVEGPDNFFFEGSTDTNSEVFVLNTSERDLGEYNVSINGSDNDNTQFTLRDLNLDIAVDDTNVSTDDTIETDVSAVAGNRNIDAVLLDSDGDEVNTSSVTQLDGQGEADVDFETSDADAGSELDTGTYTVEVTDTDTGVVVESSEITVSQADDEEAEFTENTITQERGDVLEFTIELTETSEATINFGSPDDGVEANVTVEDDNDDDQVTVRLNTYKLANSGDLPLDGGDVYSLDSDSDDNIVDQDIDSQTDDLIDAGDYDVEVQAGDQDSADGTPGISSSDDVATVTLNDRNTENAQMWTGSSDELGSVSDLDDVNEGIEEGQISQSSEIAVGDLAVHQLEVTGIEGALDARANEDVTDNFFTQQGNNGVLDLTIEEASPGANQNAAEVNLTSRNTTVIADGQNDTYFVIVDTGDVNFTTPRFESLPNDDDTALETNFTVVQNDRGDLDFTNSQFDDDENEETIIAFDANEPEINVDEPFNVSQAEAQTVTGTTNIAPGTELSLRVRSADGVTPSFLKTASPVVQSDGTYSATFDFSGQNVGDEYDIEVDSNTLPDGPVEEDGEVVERVVTPTPEPDTDTATPEPDTDTATPEPDTDTATPEPDTDTATPEPDTDTPTSTPTSTPGFGVIVALTALLAAALLAIRRE